mmetsp:Transcript_9861/g.27371  ORF Transcript_9861/g.27371 Transcript_9861/m.27371 type:complete len:427 (-) Transcript_9861:60-1340(-)
MGRRSSRKRQRKADAESQPRASKDSQAESGLPAEHPSGRKRQNARKSNSKECHDLFVPLVSANKGSRNYDEYSESSQLVQRQLLLHRLASLGYSNVAFTHTVFGPPHGERDLADEALPLDDPTKIKTSSLPRSNGDIQTIRRLHTVVENLSDVGLFVRISQNATSLGGEKWKVMSELLSGYDIVSLAPGNEVAFQAACNTATAAEIISLDYSMRSGGTSLPFRIRSADVKAAIARNAVFEIPYAPAILNSKYRKKLIQCCREFQTASAGLKPRLIFSSGSRSFQDEGGVTVQDAADMALRTPGDIRNLLCTMLGFDDKTASKVFTESADYVLKQGLERRYGNSVIRSIRVDTMEISNETAEFCMPILDSAINPMKKQSADTNDTTLKSADTKITSSTKVTMGTGLKEASPSDDASDHSGGDGFIGF